MLLALVLWFRGSLPQAFSPPALNSGVWPTRVLRAQRAEREKGKEITELTSV